MSSPLKKISPRGPVQYVAFHRAHMSCDTNEKKPLEMNEPVHTDYASVPTMSVSKHDEVQ